MDIMSAEDLKKMNEEINKEMPLSGEEQGSLETPQSQPVTAAQEAPQDPRTRAKKKKGLGKVRVFILGMAAGFMLLLIAGQLLYPIRTGAVQTGTGQGSGPQSAVGSGTISKLKLLEQCIYDYYYEPEDVTPEKLETGMYKGLMSSLGDPYTEYYTQEEYKSLMEETTGVYKGIGAYIGLDNDTNAPVFTSIMPGTPAEKAGLKAGDIICAVNGKDTLTMETAEVASLVKGEEGTDVEIKVMRDGQYVTVTATRATINVPTVTSKMLPDNIGYIQINEFDDVTPAQFEENLAQMKKEGMTSLILDLRNNPGGTVTAVTQIASGILPEGLVFYMEDKEGRKDEYKCPGADFEYPVAVLVNEYSASAAEILAGAIQDAGIGKLIGTQTYGKGIVQNLYPLDDGSALKITIADYYTRGGRNIHKVGIEPDYIVELDTEKYEKDETDTQLEKAKEVLLNAE